jgi:hypothetical protein
VHGAQLFGANHSLSWKGKSPKNSQERGKAENLKRREELKLIFDTSKI